MITNVSFLTQAWAPMVSIAAVCAALVTPIAQAQTTNYRVDIIDQLPGNVVASNLRVNESGQVLASGVRSDGGYTRPTTLVWSGPGQSSVPGGPLLGASFITDSGNIVGSDGFATISMAPNGSYTTLASGQRGDYTTVAVVAPDGDYGGTSDFSGQAIYFNQGGVVTTGQLFANAKKPGRWAGMNSFGVMAGTTDNGNGLTFNIAWVGRSGVMSKLGETVNGFGGGSYAVDVDSRGRVLGQIGTIVSLTTRRGVIWDTNNVPTLLPFQDIYAADVKGFNASSTVIASFYSISGPASAFWGINTPSGNRSWAQLVDGAAASWRVQTLQDISDSGYIVGTAVDTSNNIVAFRMTPIDAVPEAGTLMQMALGGLALVLARRRRRDARRRSATKTDTQTGAV